MKTLNLKEIGLLSISELCYLNGPQKFYIARYQRGYRWELDEIQSLLIDIRDKNPQAIYCLQPLVSTLNKNNIWELIDGQQRMTTIRIILSVFKIKYQKSLDNYYELDYDTRESSSMFLAKLTSGSFEPIPVFTDSTELINEIEKKWKDHFKKVQSENNIDNFYLFQAYYIISNWFHINNTIIDDFFNKLILETYVIWYPILELEDNQTVESIFLNLNAGKIKLTSAELIKALYILDIENSDDSWEIRNIRKDKLAQEWDLIETTLHNNQLWNFITNDSKITYETRIGLLFDLITKRTSTDGPLHSYFKYANKEEKLDWELVNIRFRKIIEWYDDIWMYHRIGFIINTYIAEFKDLLNEAKEKSKKQFRKYLDTLIIHHFKLTFSIDGVVENRFALNKLDYNRHSMDCQKVLLLHNIKTIETSLPGQRFPFNLYNEKQWSVEHIHSQNPRKLQTIGEAKDWLQDFEERIKNIPERDNDLKEFNDLKKHLDSATDSKINSYLQEKLKVFVDEVSDLLQLHHIGNLALLDKDTNSKISNRNFLGKRKILLELNENKKTEFTFIPLSTVNVFLKRYSKKTEGFQMSYWSSEDSEAYKKDIEVLLNEYLPIK